MNVTDMQKNCMERLSFLVTWHTATMFIANKIRYDNYIRHQADNDDHNDIINEISYA